MRRLGVGFPLAAVLVLGACRDLLDPTRDPMRETAAPRPEPPREIETSPFYEIDVPYYGKSLAYVRMLLGPPNIRVTGETTSGPARRERLCYEYTPVDGGPVATIDGEPQVRWGTCYLYADGIAKGKMLVLSSLAHWVEAVNRDGHLTIEVFHTNAPVKPYPWSRSR